MTYSGVPGDDRCECFDQDCAEGHTGQCINRAGMTLWRIDMEDQTGTRFCRVCAKDAMESGLFTEEVED